MTYERYYLRENPFISDSADFPIVDRDSVMKDTSTLVSDYIEAGAPGIIALLGDYGVGKTFTLLNMEGRIRNNTFLRDGTAKVYSAYMKALPQDSLSKYTLYVYRTIVESMGPETFLALLEDAKSRSGEEDFGGVRILKGLSPRLANPLVRLDSGLKEESWAYLGGEPVSASTLRRLNVTSRIDTNTKAQLMIVELLKLLALLDKKGILLMIDEWEYVFTATGAKRGVQLHTHFKELYDRIQEAKIRGAVLAPLVFLFACTPTAWNENIPSLIRKIGSGGVEPFWQRIAKTYNIPPFEPADTRDLVITRLRARRTAEAKDPLFPFAKEAVDIVHESAQGLPRKTLKRCAFLLEQALLQDRDAIDGPFAKHELASYALT